MTTINFIDYKYSWKTCSLMEFIKEGNIPSGWNDFFNKKDVISELLTISKELDKIRINKTIYPEINHVFKAFYLTPIEKINSIILGQDPYHNGSATGLCFSVKAGNKINPSLKNIYKELKNSGFNNNIENGDLTHWAKQGVLMLNTSLTVEKGLANSHSYLWEKFSNMIIKYIDCQKKQNISWILFGKQAYQITKDHVIFGIKYKTSHPSPFSAHRSTNYYESFFGSKIFSKITKIKW